jgi:hypothetical protein
MSAGADTTGRLVVAGPSAALPLRQRGPTFSPNGRWVAYSSDESGRAEVYVRPFPDTKAFKRQVSVAGGEAPRWSHDGRELYFVDASRYMVAVPVAPGETFVTGVQLGEYDVRCRTRRTVSDAPVRRRRRRACR